MVMRQPSACTHRQVTRESWRYEHERSHKCAKLSAARAKGPIAKLHERIHMQDGAGLTPPDPLSPLAARLLLELAEEQPTRPYNGGAPIISQDELISILSTPERLKTLCSQLVNTVRDQVDSSKLSLFARERLHNLIDRGAALSLVRVRLAQALGGLAVRLWDAPPSDPSRPPLPVRLPCTASAADLWELAVRQHVPCVVGAGAFAKLAKHCSAETLASLYGNHRVRARQVFTEHVAGHRTFEDAPTDQDTVHFGQWCRKAAAGDEDAKRVYPAKLKLQETLPELAAHLETREDTPLTRFGACVGAAAEEGAFMYAGAGENTTQTHFDPAENFLLVVRGSKRLQLFPPGDAALLYPSPNPSYHSSEIKAFTEPRDAPAGYPLYRSAHPVSVSLEEGEMLYLPAYWYHGVTGGDGFNVILAWWTAIHPNKGDDAGACTGVFESERRHYPDPFRVQPGA